jgi:hypothetical protein
VKAHGGPPIPPARNSGSVQGSWDEAAAVGSAALVIQLPPDLFFGTPIATCILVLKKSKTDNKVMFIDASDQFVRVGNKNKLTPEHRQTRIWRVGRVEESGSAL